MMATLSIIVSARAAQTGTVTGRDYGKNSSDGDERRCAGARILQSDKSSERVREPGIMRLNRG
jgi:hypothetical protein